MAEKWHINKHGVPAPCKAKKNCPLGGAESHYSSKDQADKAIAEQFESQYGLLGNDKMSVKRKRDLSDLIQRISGTKSPGFSHECYASLSVAEEMGLDRIAIIDENGLTITISTSEDEKTPVNVNLFVDKSIESVSAYYTKMGISIKNKNALARVIYHSDDPNKDILVQSGGPNVLDAAIIRADEVVDLIEVKELGKGAQLPAVSLETTKDGAISERSLSKQNKYIRDKLRDFKIQDADGSDVQVDFGNERDNKVLPLYHFVEQYRAKGATAFVYTSDEGKQVNKVDLTGTDDEVVERLLEHNIEANVTLRANLNKQKVNKADLERFNTILSKEYFKSGRASSTESFTLKGIREDKISRAGEWVRIGGYIVPIKYDEYKENLNKRIKKDQMKAFRLVLTGNIKTSY